MNNPFLSSLNISPRSLVVHDDVEYALMDGQVAVFAAATSPVWKVFDGKMSETSGKMLLLGPLSPKNAAALRAQLPWLQPRPHGLKASAGLGDRLGLATPGHVRAVVATGSKVAPIFAQQSIREMTRTGRSPQQVMDDATWGVFAEGWRGGVGADADHLKTPEDIDACLAAGFTFFTIDPGAHVNGGKEHRSAETASLSDLRQLAAQLPADVQPQASGLAGKTFEIEAERAGMPAIQFDEATLLKAVVKYGKAVAHVALMYQHLIRAAAGRPVELEVSVDETDLPTSHAEHFYIASELKRLGVQWVSLAPRYVGRFEKGVDYIGDLAAFETDFAGHAAIAHQLGPYKLSLHSGSDKFSVYPIAARLTKGLVHLKTAGTSYLEALRTIAALDPVFFRQLYVFSRERYETDKVSYHVSAQLSRAPLPENVSEWPGLLDQFDAREILHVTFGSVLTDRKPDGSLRFYDRFVQILRDHPDAYATNLEKHFIRHLQPFVAEI